MAILQQLGLNQTVYIQFFIFIIAFIALSQIAFKPYFHALEKREEKTKGGESLALEIQKQSADLKQQYENSARKVNGEIKTIFDTFRDQANKEYESILQRARTESQKMIDAVRTKINIELSNETKKIKDDAPKLAEEITHKLLAK